MLEIDQKKNCCGCQACANICPRGCIKMCFDEEGFLYPKIDREKCINCGLCKKVCPIERKKTEKSTSGGQDVKVYAAFNLDVETRLKSSSGGIFSLLAENVLAKGGVVFGAGFGTDLSVQHMGVEKAEDLSRLRTSKYVQSDTKTSFQEAKKFLDDGRLVLFSGTPCQIEGLCAFLRKKYDNLITQDVICHGVPSPVAWQKYLKIWQDKSGEKVTYACFRKKEKRMSKTRFVLAFDSGKTYQKPYRRDEFVASFLKNEALRPSCYDCAFKGKNRASDITLADFWGIELVCPSMNDGKGTSLVFVNSEKGEKIFQELTEKMKFKEVNFKKVLIFNKNYFSSVRKPKTKQKKDA